MKLTKKILIGLFAAAMMALYTTGMSAEEVVVQESTAMESSLTAFAGSGTLTTYTGNIVYTGSTEKTYAVANSHPLVSLEEPETNREIIASGEYGDNLTWTLYDDGELVFSGIGKLGSSGDSNYAYIPWSKFRSSITKVTFKTGVTSIGNFLFRNCDSLATVTIPDSVTSIGRQTFIDCDSLTSVTIPDSVSSIGDDAFNGCDSLTIVTIGDSVTSIGYGTFDYCYSLTKIEVNVNNETYSNDEYGVLFNKSKAKLIQYPVGNTRGAYVIPNSVAYIGYNAFRNCGSLTSVTIPDSVTYIGDWAFCDCTSLTSVTIPDSVTSIGDYAFEHCTGLTSMTILSRDVTFGSSVFRRTPSDFTLYGYAGSTTEAYAAANGHKFVALEDPTSCGKTAKWSLDEGTLTISGTGAMYDFSYSTLAENAVPWAASRADVKKVVIGKDISSIGTFAFYRMPNLTEVVFEEGSAISYIGEGAFGYTGIKNITIPANNIEIAAKAFYFNSALETVAFEENSILASIGNYAFRNCGALQSLYIPETIGHMGTNILYASTQAVVSVADGSYAHKYAETYGYNYEVRDSLTAIASGSCGDNAKWVLSNTGILTINGTGALYDFNFSTMATDAAPWAKMRGDVVKVIIGKDITSIGTYAFYKMTNLAEVEFENGSALTAIGVGAFGYTTALKDVAIPASVMTMEKNAFYFSGLEDIIFEGNALTTIGHYAFRNTALTAIAIPASVTNIGGVILYGTNATMYVVNGSAAHNYAVRNGYNFVIVG